jgi:hypothetical protein
MCLGGGWIAYSRNPQIGVTANTVIINDKIALIYAIAQMEELPLSWTIKVKCPNRRGILSSPPYIVCCILHNTKLETPEQTEDKGIKNGKLLKY